MWKMHFSDVVETVLLETVFEAADKTHGPDCQRKNFKIPKRLKDKGITDRDFQDVGNAIMRIHFNECMAH